MYMQTTVTGDCKLWDKMDNGHLFLETAVM